MVLVGLVALGYSSITSSTVHAQGPVAVPNDRCNCATDLNADLAAAEQAAAAATAASNAQADAEKRVALGIFQAVLNRQPPPSQQEREAAYAAYLAALQAADAGNVIRQTAIALVAAQQIAAAWGRYAACMAVCAFLDE